MFFIKFYFLFLLVSFEVFYFHFLCLHLNLSWVGCKGISFVAFGYYVLLIVCNLSYVIRDKKQDNVDLHISLMYRTRGKPNGIHSRRWNVRLCYKLSKDFFLNCRNRLNIYPINYCVSVEGLMCVCVHAWMCDIDAFHCHASMKRIITAALSFASLSSGA